MLVKDIKFKYKLIELIPQTKANYSLVDEIKNFKNIKIVSLCNLLKHYSDCIVLDYKDNDKYEQTSLKILVKEI